MSLDFNLYISQLLNIVVAKLPSVVMAIFILIVGHFTIKLLIKTFRKLLSSRNIDSTISTFLISLLTWALRIILFITIISKLGVETSTFVATLGAAGLAIGLALQGSLSNFAGGILIILFKPFNVGDIIEAQGETGTVREIQILNTRITTLHNQEVYIPNSLLSNGLIKNFTQSGVRRLDISVAIHYQSDLEKAKEITLKVANSLPKVLKNPSEPVVYITNMLDSGIQIEARLMVHPNDFFEVRSDFLIGLNFAFLENDIKISYPQREITITDHTQNKSI